MMSVKTFWQLPLTLSMATVAMTMASTIGVAEILSHQRKAELTNLLRQDCGSCHGMTFKGGLGNPLLPEEMAAQDGDVLREIILDGVAGTPMPPWRGLLSVADAKWMVEQLQLGLIKRGNDK